MSWLELSVGLALGWVAAHVQDGRPRGTAHQPAGDGDTRDFLLRASLVALQVLMAVVILSGAGILIRSFANVIALPLGFEPRGLVAANVSSGLALLADPAGVAQLLLDAAHSAHPRAPAHLGLGSLSGPRTRAPRNMFHEPL